MQKIAYEFARSVDGARIEPKDALVCLSRRILETDAPEVVASGRREREESIYTVLYHRCPQCRTTHLATTDGPIEIPSEVVDRVEGEAVKVVISPEEESNVVDVPREARDMPNTPTLVRKVRLRDGGICANPMCKRRLGLHAHHITFRAHGGRTVLNNECLLCPPCHAVLHQGLLTIEGDPVTGLTWRTKSDAIDFDLDAEFRGISAVSEVRFVENSTTVANPSPNTSPDESVPKDLIRALRNIGYKKKDARARISWAWEALSGGGGRPKEEDILLKAMQGR